MGVVHSGKLGRTKMPELEECMDVGRGGEWGDGNVVLGIWMVEVGWKGKRREDNVCEGVDWMQAMTKKQVRVWLHLGGFLLF